MGYTGIGFPHPEMISEIGTPDPCIDMRARARMRSGEGGVLADPLAFALAGHPRRRAHPPRVDVAIVSKVDVGDDADGRLLEDNSVASPPSRSGR